MRDAHLLLLLQQKILHKELLLIKRARDFLENGYYPGKAMNRSDYVADCVMNQY